MPGSQPERAQTAPAIGKYEIVEEIGQGGYGKVYKGFDPLIKRFVAIKTCASADREVRERFLREAEISGKLDHPNIVRIYDSGFEGEVPYLVQEHLDGEDLDERIAHGDYLPFPEKLLYLIQIARGLDYAHSRGVIHRDVKPANVRVLDDGTAKIVDFGIAKLSEAASDLTCAGMTVGTAAYIAPEQIRGEPAEPSTDVFSFGVLAYELLTSERPFGRDTISATFYQILNEDPPSIALHWRGCPPEAESLVAACLEKEPGRRPAGFAEVLARLEGIRDDLKSGRVKPEWDSHTRPVRSLAAARPRRLPPRPDSASLAEVALTPAADPRESGLHPRPRRRSRRWPWLLAALALGLGAAGYLLFWERPEPFRALAEAAGLAGPLEAEPSVRSPETAAPGPTEDSPAGESSAPVDDPAGRAGPPAAEDVSTPPEAGPAGPPEESASESEADGRRAAAPPLPFQKPEPAPPEGPVPARLYFPAAWSERVTVSVDGAPPLALGSPHSVEVEPGKHLLTFSLVTPVYRTFKTVEVVVDEAEERRVVAPLVPPGMLTVQANLESPQGIVKVDDGPPQRTPLRRQVLAPGRHRVTVFAPPGVAVEPVRATLDLKPGRETVVTFDLTGGRPILVRDQPIRRGAAQ